MTLLSKTRKLNRLLQKAAGTSVNFMEMGEVLRDIIDANVYVVSRKGKILGFGIARMTSDAEMQTILTGTRRFPPEVNHWLMSIDETTSNSDADSLYGPLVANLNTLLGERYITVIPIIGAGDRIGTLLITRQHSPFGLLSLAHPRRQTLIGLRARVLGAVLGGYSPLGRLHLRFPSALGFCRLLQLRRGQQRRQVLRRAAHLLRNHRRGSDIAAQRRHRGRRSWVGGQDEQARHHAGQRDHNAYGTTP